MGHFVLSKAPFLLRILPLKSVPSTSLDPWWHPEETVGPVVPKVLLISSHFLFLKFYLFIDLWLRWVFVAAWGLSLVSASRAYSSVVMHGLLIEAASLVAEQCCGFNVGARGAVAPRLQSIGSTDMAHGFSCSSACGIFPDQGSNLCLLHWWLYH